MSDGVRKAVGVGTAVGGDRVEMPEEVGRGKKLGGGETKELEGEEGIVGTTVVWGEEEVV